MNYDILRTYRAFGGQRYAVFYFPDLDTQNEAPVSETESLDDVAARLYDSISQPAQVSAQDQPVSQESTSIEIYNATGELIFP
jgi:hypothetical protein